MNLYWIFMKHFPEKNEEIFFKYYIDFEMHYALYSPIFSQQFTVKT